MKPESQLDLRVQELIKLICNVQAMEEMMVEMKYDTKKAPLGRTSDSVLHSVFIFPCFFTVVFHHHHGWKLANINEEEIWGEELWREVGLFWKLKGERESLLGRDINTVYSCGVWSLAGPAGKLTVAQIKAGYQSLKKIEDCIRAGQRGRALMEACNEFYTRIPHDFG